MHRGIKIIIVEFWRRRLGTLMNCIEGDYYLDKLLTYTHGTRGRNDGILEIFVQRNVMFAHA